MLDLNATSQTLSSPVNHQSFQNNEDLCVICCTTFDRKNKVVTVTKCGHTFDKSCLDIWLKDHFTCPNCRTPLKERALRQQQAQHFIRDPINLFGLQLDAMNDDYWADSSPLELARFREQCCLNEQHLNGRMVSPETVVNGYQRAHAAPVDIACFMEKCCLSGRFLNGQQVTPDSVANEYRLALAPLELARFMEKCCLNGLLLNGQQVTPHSVVEAYRLADAPLELESFREQCHLMGWILTEKDANQKPEPVRPVPVQNHCCNIL